MLRREVCRGVKFLFTWRRKSSEQSLVWRWRTLCSGCRCSASHHQRAGIAQIFSEFVASFGLLSVIWGCLRFRSQVIPFAVSAYITAAYWFTASTSFANPAVTLARSLSDTFAGIRPIDAPGFIVAQFAGALAGTLLFRWLSPPLSKEVEAVLLPHNHD